MMVIRVRGAFNVAPYAAVLICVVGLAQPDLLPASTPWWGIILARAITTISRAVAIVIVVRAVGLR